MHRITLEQIFKHHITQKYVNRSEWRDRCRLPCVSPSQKHHASVDATKAGFLHDIGHHTWYTGEWDYDLYKKNDIHAIKGAERAHKLLIRLGEHPKLAKEISIAILLHTDSFLVEQEIERTSLQNIIKWADEADEEPGGAHHYRTISYEKALKAIQQLDRLVERELQIEQAKLNNKTEHSYQ